MTKYKVTAWCNFPHYATFEVRARSFKAALSKAREQVTGEVPEPCSGGEVEWDEFEIVRTGSSKSVTYFEPSLQRAVAVGDLLEALELCEEVLSELARLDDGTPSVSALFMARDAIAMAKGGRE